MYRWQVMTALTDQRLVGIIRESDQDHARRAGESLLAAGLRAVEVTMNTPGALDVIRALAGTAPEGALIGAGTVLDGVTARLATLAGARFLVSPSLSAEVIETGHRYGVPVIPGAFSPTEITDALSAGADAVKLFPSRALRPDVVPALRGPLPQAPIIPTGVPVADCVEWIRAGAVAVGVTGELYAGGTEATAKRVAGLLADLDAAR